MDDDLNPGIFRADVIDVLRQEALMHRAVALPENDFGFLQAIGSDAAVDQVRVPDDHFVQRDAHGESGVAAEVLIGEEENFFVFREAPVEGRSGIRRGADYASALAAESFDGGGRIHVGDRRDALAFVCGQASADQLIPAVFDLGDVGHVGHGASGVEVGKNGDLAGPAEHVGAFGHEVHAAEDDVLAAGPGGFLGKFVGVSAKIGEADDFIALVVVSENDALAAQSFAGSGDARVHGVVRKDQIIFQTAKFRSRSHRVLLSAPGTSSTLNAHSARRWNGDVESLL